MFIRFLKKIAVVLIFLFATQGCAVFVGDDDGFHHFNHFHHGYQDNEHYSLEQTQVTGNHIPAHRSELDVERR